jgi:hypothetical protein
MTLFSITMASDSYRFIERLNEIPGIDVMIEGVVVRMNEERRRCGCDVDAEFLHRRPHLTFFWREIPVFRRKRFHLAPYLTPETDVTASQYESRYNY